MISQLIPPLRSECAYWATRRRAKAPESVTCVTRGPSGNSSTQNPSSPLKPSHSRQPARRSTALTLAAVSGARREGLREGMGGRLLGLSDHLHAVRVLHVVVVHERHVIVLNIDAVNL